MSAAAGGGTALRVRVLRAGDGRPVPGATVTVLADDGTQIVRGHGDDGGEFRTGLPRTGEYLLIAAAAGHEPRSATVSLPGPGEHAVEMSLPGRHGLVTGVVSGPAGPVAGATVVVHDMRGEVVATTTTDGAGRYTVDSLSPALYTVVAVAPDTDPVTDSVVVDTSGDTVWDPGLPAASAPADGAGSNGAAPAEAGLGGTAGGAGLSGTARTADGQPVPHARITVLRSDGIALAIADADADGRYAVPTLPPGDHTVITTGYPPTTDVLRLDGRAAVHDPVLGHPDLAGGPGPG